MNLKIIRISLQAAAAFPEFVGKQNIEAVKNPEVLLLAKAERPNSRNCDCRVLPATQFCCIVCLRAKLICILLEMKVGLKFSAV